MQKVFALLVVVFVLTACNHQPTAETTVTLQEPPPLDEVYTPYDSIMLHERIEYTYFHHFSDSVEQDSFVVEIPAGDIIGGVFYFSIYSADGKLLFDDELPTEIYMGSATNNKNLYTEDMLIDSLKADVSHFLDLQNFKYVEDNEAIRKARGSEIENMVGWNEAVNDPRRMTFRYWSTPYSEFYVAYSHKANGGTVIVAKEYFD